MRGTGEKEEDAASPSAVRKSSIPTAAFPLFTHANYTSRTLRLELKRRSRLPAAECLTAGIALTEALNHLHSHGLVHRDVKPSNIIFAGGRPKLADIGLVTDVATGDDTRSIVGTEGYLSPEGPGTPQADLFALGKVLYEAVTGLDRRQFPQLPPDLRDWPDAAQVFELNEIIVRACAHDTRPRYQSAEDMGKDLSLLKEGKSVRHRHLWQHRAQLTKKFALAATLASLILAGLFFARKDAMPHSMAKQSTGEAFETSGTTNREAYELYVKGREAMKSGYADAYERAVAHLEPVVKLDPRFARGWSALALIYWFLEV